MGELIPFPTIKKSTSPETVSNNINASVETNILEFKRKISPIVQEKNTQACFLEGVLKIVVGGSIIIKVRWKKYKGVVDNILQRDGNNNITKIAYTIPFLSADDPFKFGEADFKYIVEKYD